MYFSGRFRSTSRDALDRGNTLGGRCTARLVAEHLRALGLEVRTGVARTAVVGRLKGGKPGPDGSVSLWMSPRTICV